MPRSQASLMFVLVNSLLLACNSSDSEGPASPDPNDGQSFSTEIVAGEGGRLATTGDTITVDIPSGALDENTAITLFVRKGDSDSMTSIYELGPGGTQFRLPVTISIAFDEEPGSKERFVLARRDAGGWSPIPGSRLVKGRIVGTTRHFSSFSGRRVDAEESVYPWTEGQGDENAMTYWTWTDPTTNLTWQMPTAVRVMDWYEAVDYCDNLYVEGDGWRLPSINELRSLIRDCPATQTGGSCAVTNECLDLWECHSDACNGCEDGGCNWPPELFYEGESNCVTSYWSSSTYHAVIPGSGQPTPEDGLNAWAVMFAGGLIGFSEKSGEGGLREIRVRCVR